MKQMPKIADGTPCSYCGGRALEMDHVVPVTALRPDKHRSQRYADMDWVVPACRECNGMLSDRMLHTVPLRAKWLYGRYRKKYAKLMLNATWTDDELAELSGTFKMLALETMLAQAELDHRLAMLRKIAEMDSDYLKPTGWK